MSTAATTSRSPSAASGAPGRLHHSPGARLHLIRFYGVLVPKAKLLKRVFEPGHLDHARLHRVTGDGAGRGRSRRRRQPLHILARIVLPLCVQGLVAVSIFVVVFTWNEYFFALVFTTRDARTAPVVIGEMLSTVESVQWGLIFAAATVQLVPVLALVITLQRG